MMISAQKQTNFNKCFRSSTLLQIVLLTRIESYQDPQPPSQTHCVSILDIFLNNFFNESCEGIFIWNFDNGCTLLDATKLNDILRLNYYYVYLNDMASYQRQPHFFHHPKNNKYVSIL